MLWLVCGHAVIEESERYFAAPFEAQGEQDDADFFARPYTYPSCRGAPLS